MADINTVIQRYNQATDTDDNLYPITKAENIESGTFKDIMKANSTAMTSLSTIQLRNIYAGTTDLEDGVSTLAAGVIYLVYEE